MSGDAAGIARNGFVEPDLRTLSVALTADALDTLGARQQVMDSRIRPIRPGIRLVGWARAIEVRATSVVPEEPYVGEMAAIASLVPGDVPVYHVDVAVEAALFGELFSLAARAQGAVGAVLDGPVRDVRQMCELGYAVFANGVSPYDTRGRAEVVAHDVPVACGGVDVATGDLIVADDDGVVVVPTRYVAPVLESVVAKVTGERGARADLLNGANVHDVWAKWHVF
jgi:regulator of RNase E activity RraA